MMLLPLVSALLLPSPLQEGSTWTELPLPAPCRPTPAARAPLEITDGAHLRGVALEDLAEPRHPTEPVPVGTLIQLLEDELRRRRLDLRVEPGPNSLVVRGTPEALAAARGVLARVEALEETLAIDLSLVLTPAGEEPRHLQARCRSGERVVLGKRRYLDYLGWYDVNVASDSGVAEPETLVARYGQTVHLSASRLGGGRRVLIEGHLDLAQLVELAVFDPGTPDLGIVEEPTIASAQVVFSGVVDSGGTLTVELAGLPLSPPDWSLTITARARLDPADPATAEGWTVLDLAWLARPPPAPAPLAFDRPFPRPRNRGPASSRSSRALGSGAMTPSALARLVTEDALGEAAPLWSETLLFLPAADPTQVRAARALARDLAPPPTTTTLVVERGDLRAAIPCAAGRDLRLLVGRAFTRVTDYGTQLAPQTWMPQPELRQLFDGLGLTGILRGGALEGQAWVLGVSDREGLAEELVGLANLQRVEQELEGCALRLTPGDGPRTLLGGLGVRLVTGE